MAKISFIAFFIHSSLSGLNSFLETLQTDRPTRLVSSRLKTSPSLTFFLKFNVLYFGLKVSSVSLSECLQYKEHLHRGIETYQKDLVWLFSQLSILFEIALVDHKTFIKLSCQQCLTLLKTVHAGFHALIITFYIRYVRTSVHDTLTAWRFPHAPNNHSWYRSWLRTSHYNNNNNSCSHKVCLNCATCDSICDVIRIIHALV